MAAAATTSRAPSHKNLRKTGDGRPGAIRTYRNALAYLNTLFNLECVTGPRRAKIQPSLGNTQKLLAAFGNPHKKLCVVHVAGTKGKGSTCAMLASMLQANKLRVGVYTSPHLTDLRERIRINNHLISETEFTRLIVRIAQAAGKVVRNGAITYFEALTVAALLYFAEQEVDVVILETGLGGRLDSTNVVPRPAVCAITAISYDHTDILGSTLAAIAEEKAGIFKPGVTAISVPQVPEVKRVLKKVAERVGATLLFAGDDLEFSYRFERSRATGPHTRVSVITPTGRYEHLAVPLPGEHQAVNCGLALGLLDALKGHGFKIDEEAAVSGLANVRLEGRMEIICEEPRVMVDGAHNAASIEALMRAIGQNVPYDSMVVIFGCNADKDVDGMLRHIQLGADKIIFTRSNSPRAVDPHELATRFAEVSGRMAQVEPDLAAAVRTAAKPITREDLLCITGSFYLVGEAKKLFTDKDYVQQLLR